MINLNSIIDRPRHAEKGLRFASLAAGHDHSVTDLVGRHRGDRERAKHDHPEIRAAARLTGPKQQWCLLVAVARSLGLDAELLDQRRILRQLSRGGAFQFFRSGTPSVSLFANSRSRTAGSASAFNTLALSLAMT